MLMYNLYKIMEVVIYYSFCNCPYNQYMWYLIISHDISPISTVKHIEKQKREASKIRWALKRTRFGALTYVLVPSPDSYIDAIRQSEGFDHLSMEYICPRVQIANGKNVKNWDLINDKSKVERLTLDCMRCHFAQSQCTPFTDDLGSVSSLRRKHKRR